MANAIISLGHKMILKTKSFFNKKLISEWAVSFSVDKKLPRKKIKLEFAQAIYLDQHLRNVKGESRYRKDRLKDQIWSRSA